VARAAAAVNGWSDGAGVTWSARATGAGVGWLHSRCAVGHALAGATSQQGAAPSDAQGAGFES
jgi:hypothetical protein